MVLVLSACQYGYPLPAQFDGQESRWHSFSADCGRAVLMLRHCIAQFDGPDA